MMSSSCASAVGLSKAQCASASYSYTLIVAWIALSALLILFNKWLLTDYQFAFPVTLTMMHMVFCFTLSAILISLDFVPAVKMTRPVFLRQIVPIGALFAGTLYCGNAAYLHLSVSFLQMLKALMPTATYACGVLYGLEKPSSRTISIMVVITVGVMIASYGELQFVWTGVILQLIGIATESNRIVLIQRLMQDTGIKMNPIQSMYYICPICFLFLIPLYFIFEHKRLTSQYTIYFLTEYNASLLFSMNMFVAFGLNVSVYLLVGNTSALTMNIAGANSLSNLKTDLFEY